MSDKKRYYQRGRSTAKAVANQMNRHPNDPTPEEIWGTPDKIGLAEQIRMERPPRQNEECKRVHLEMKAYGFGKLIWSED